MSSKKLLICFAFAFTIISFYSTNAQLVEKWRVDIPALPDYNSPAYYFDSTGNAYGIRYKWGIVGNQYRYTFNIYKVSADGILEWSIEDTPSVEGGHFGFSRSGVDKYGNVYLLGNTYNDSIQSELPAVVKYSSNGLFLFAKLIQPSQYNTCDVRAWGVNSEGNIFAMGMIGTHEGNIGYAMGISPEGVRISESILNNVDGCNQSNGPKGPDMFGNYVVEYLIYDGNNEYIKYLVGFNSAAGIRWSASASTTHDPLFDLTNYIVFQYGNLYFNPYPYNIIEKYTTNFQHQWTKNYSSYNVRIKPESPIDECIIIYEADGTDPFACYNADGSLRWRNSLSEPSYSHTAYGPDNNIYTITGYSPPSTFMKINSQTGELIWTDTVNLGPLAYTQMRIDQNGIITFAEMTCVVQFLQGIEITHPKKDTLMIAGEVDTIRWKGGKENQFLSLEYSVDGGTTYNWINLDQVEASEGKYGWDIPDDLIGRKALIRILDASNGDSLGASDTFKIKPYIITRVDEDGEYVAYDINTDRWGFWNDDPDVWPSSWYQKFDYWGTDPFTNKNYSVWQGDSVFFNAKSSDFPDWISFVNAFGVDSCYADTYIGSYYPKALQLWKAIKKRWNGSCFGIAISNALAFEKRDQFQIVYPDFPDIISPYLVTSDTNTVKVVNELYTHQYGNPHEANLGIALQKTPNQTLNELRDLLREDNVTIRTLSFLSNDPFDPGGHAIVGYKIKKDKNIDDRYYIYVYDNSNPDSLNAYVIVDTLVNGGNGSWFTPYAWQSWGGDKYLFLEDTASSFFANPIIPKKSKYISPFVLAENDLLILSSTNVNTMIIDEQSNQTGIGSLGMTINIPGSYPLIKRNGSSGPPYGYYLPKDNYSVVMNNYLSDTLNTFFFTGNKSFEYERYGATNSQTDRLFFDGGVSVINPDAEEKSIKLLNITTTTDDEKVFILRSLELAQNDSVKIENPDDNRLNLISYGSAKNYQIELNQASELGIGRFLTSNIFLTENTTHKLVPNWGDFADLMLTIFVNEGNDETIDDTLYLDNEVTGVGDDQGSLIPTEYRLEQNYPNPFNPSTKISYQLPVSGNVTLKVYDILGNEVSTLVNEYKPAGTYEVEFNSNSHSRESGNLTSGVYFYQLRAGSFVQTKKMVYLK